MTARFLSVAEAEFSDAAAFYEDQDQGLGEIFIEHIIRSIGYIERNPLASPLIDRRVRKASLQKFPYSIIYYLSESELVIVAVAHHKRRPDYWHDRIGSL